MASNPQAEPWRAEFLNDFPVVVTVSSRVRINERDPSAARPRIGEETAREAMAPRPAARGVEAGARRGATGF